MGSAFASPEAQFFPQFPTQITIPHLDEKLFRIIERAHKQKMTAHLDQPKRSMSFNCGFGCPTNTAQAESLGSPARTCQFGSFPNLFVGSAKDHHDRNYHEACDVGGPLLPHKPNIPSSRILGQSSLNSHCLVHGFWPIMGLKCLGLS